MLQIVSCDVTSRAVSQECGTRESMAAAATSGVTTAAANAAALLQCGALGCHCVGVVVNSSYCMGFLNLNCNMLFLIF